MAIQVLGERVDDYVRAESQRALGVGRAVRIVTRLRHGRPLEHPLGLIVRSSTILSTIQCACMNGRIRALAYRVSSVARFKVRAAAAIHSSFDAHASGRTGTARAITSLATGDATGRAPATRNNHGPVKTRSPAIQRTNLCTTIHTPRFGFISD